MSPPPRGGTAPPPKPDADPIVLFAALVRATAARDFRTATTCRKALRKHGWSIAPLSERGAG